jgi:hypothetical protein
VSITPDEVRAVTSAVPGTPPLPEAALPAAEIERMARALNRHRSARTTLTTTTGSAAPESEQS